MKRLISAKPSEIVKADRQSLKEAILASDGRVILGETVVTSAPLIEGVTNAEVMVAFGADMVLLNELDVFEPQIQGFNVDSRETVAHIKHLIQAPIGVNLEPVNHQADVFGGPIKVSPGRMASPEAFRAAKALGIDFILITANPSTGVTNQAILEVIATARKEYDGLIFAGKMHSAGLSEEIIDIDIYKLFIQHGADGIILPSPGTVPGVSFDKAYQACQVIRQAGAIVIGAIGTSQESADTDTIRDIALMNKQVGVAIHHIGDGAYGRTPEPENLMQLGITIRGKRHHYFRMSQSKLS